MTARPLQLISSMATREMLASLVGQYAHESGRGVQADAAGGVDVAKRIAAGEPHDVVVLAANAIDKLIADGALLAGSRVDLVRSGVAIAVPAAALGDAPALKTKGCCTSCRTGWPPTFAGSKRISGTTASTAAVNSAWLDSITLKEPGSTLPSTSTTNCAITCPVSACERSAAG